MKTKTFKILKIYVNLTDFKSQNIIHSNTIYLGVNHWRQGTIYNGSCCGHGQVGCDGEHHHVRCCLVVQPEGQPRDEDVINIGTCMLNT